jgi:hypothetical protein
MMSRTSAACSVLPGATEPWMDYPQVARVVGGQIAAIIQFGL